MHSSRRTSRKGPWEARGPGILEEDQGLEEGREPRRIPSRKVADIINTWGKRRCVVSLISSRFLVSSSSSHCRGLLETPSNLETDAFSELEWEVRKARQGWGSENMEEGTQVLPALGFQASSSSWVLPCLLMNTEPSSPWLMSDS